MFAHTHTNSSAVGMHLALVIPQLMEFGLNSMELKELVGRYSRGRLFWIFLVPKCPNEFGYQNYEAA